MAIEFKEPEIFLNSFCEIVEKEVMGDVTITLSKDRAVGNEEPFRSLNFLNSNDKFRMYIFKPLYDPPIILNHNWLNGCSSQ